MLKKCPNCGKSNLETSKNCLFCNASLDSASAQSFNKAVNPRTEQVVVPQKSTFRVSIADIGPNKIHVIKEVKDITKLDLLKSTRLVESKGVIKENATKEEAELIKVKFASFGAQIIID